MTEFQVSANAPDLANLKAHKPNSAKHQNQCRKVARALGVENGTAFSGDTRNITQCQVKPSGLLRKGPQTVYINGTAVAEFTQPVNIPNGQNQWCKITGGYQKAGKASPYYITVYTD